MEYRIDYPIHFDCNLQCYYCFHTDYFKHKHPFENGRRECKFTIDEYKCFRNTHIKDANRIVLNLHGGETFFGPNVELVNNIMLSLQNDKEEFDLLSNGMCQLKDYEYIIKTHGKKIWRIGFTYHRKMLNEEQTKIFESNVKKIAEWLPGKVYVKELFRVEDKLAIIQNKFKWNSWKILFKIQDYKGDNRGANFTEYQKYSTTDKMLIDSEYKHPLDQPCCCLKGFRTFGIRGYDEWSGDVVACWIDPVVIGNIQENWFHPDYKVCRMEDGSGQRDVRGVEKIYRGTFERDRPLGQSCKH